jgi:hypothetical protein
MADLIDDVTFLCYLPNRSSDKPGCDANGLVSIGDKCRDDIHFSSHKLISFEKPTVESSFEYVHEPAIIPDSFNRNLMTKMTEWFDTSHMLYFQSDGFIQNTKAWTNDFLDYDYIGAPCMKPAAIRYARDVRRILIGGKTYEDYTDVMWVGNGGFSLRSKKYCDVVSNLWRILPESHRLANEDILVNLVYREYMKRNGVKIAPIDVAFRFSTEHLAPNFELYTQSFGFHEINRFRAHGNFKNQNPMSWLPSEAQVNHVTSSRRKLLSDILRVQHVQ